jgi:hypothetical protein
MSGHHHHKKPKLSRFGFFYTFAAETLLKAWIEFGRPVSTLIDPGLKAGKAVV